MTGMSRLYQVLVYLPFCQVCGKKHVNTPPDLLLPALSGWLESGPAFAPRLLVLGHPMT